MRIEVKTEYKELLPPLTGEDYEALKDSIKTEGQHYPIIVNTEGFILDGYHRYKICQELNIEPKFEVREILSPLHEKKFVIEVNLKRRHLTPFQKIEASLPLIEIEKNLARQRQLRQLEHVKEHLSLASREANDTEGKKAEIIAAKIGVSRATLERGLAIINEGAETTKEKLRRGETTIGAEYKKIIHERKIEELEQKLETLPPIEGKYQVIVIDPPWEFEGEYDPDGHRVVPAYPTLSIDEISNLKIPADESGCVLWLWTPIKNLHDAFHIIERWGFEPKTVLTWVKDRMGIGAWLRGQTEHCIMAVKGNPMVKLSNQTTVIFGKVKGHSRKPDEFYTIVEALCIGKKLDYFARESRNGWDTYGTLENAE